MQATPLLCAPQAQWHSTLCRCILPIGKVSEAEGVCDRWTPGKEQAAGVWET